MRRRFVRVAIAAAVVAAVAAITAVAGQGPGLAPLKAGDGNGPELKPEIVDLAGQGRFDGQVKKLPPGQVKKGEARPEPQVPNEAPGAATKDGATQSAVTSSAVSAPAPGSSFEGESYTANGAGWPPDTNGDVGLTQYVQTVNTSFAVYDKSTHTKVAGNTLDALWATANTGTPCDNANQGDPVVVYDPIGDRWIITDFAWSSFSTGPFYECFAVSQSNDAGGSYYFYAYKIETGSVLPDYPKLGVWPDGIYMSANDFASSGSQSFKNVQVWAFNRTALEAGQGTSAVSFNVSSRVQGVSVFSLLPSNSRSVTGQPPAGRPNLFASIYGSYNVRVWKFHVDWTNLSSSTFSGPTNVPIATFNVGPSAATEPSPGNPLDTLSYRVMMQNQYTNIGGTESLWLTHTVGNGGTPNLAQVRWYQLNVTGGTVSTTPKQQSTYAPDSSNRFTPSLAVDKNGDMAIGYTVSSASLYPSLRYSARAAGDAANTLGAENSLVEGTGYQCCTFSDGSSNQRWGDYSAMTIDPSDGCTFWYTGEYYDSQPTALRPDANGVGGDNWKTRVGSFRLPTC